MRQTLLLLVLFIYLSALSQNADTVRLLKKVSVLNNRLFISAPVYTNGTIYPSDIMSAQPTANDLFMIQIETKEGALLIQGNELFKYGSNRFLQEVRSDKNLKDYTTKLLISNPRAYGVLSTPLKYDTSDSYVELNRLLVRTGDNSIIVLTASIDKDSFSLKRDYFTSLSEKMFKTVVPGERINKRDKRTEIMKVTSDKNIRFNVPENYSATVSKGPDFIVFRFTKYTPYASDNYSSLTIYNGGYPSAFYPEEGFDKKQGKMIPGKFLGHNFEWLSFINDSSKYQLREQFIEADEVYKESMFHVAISGNNSKDIALLLKMVESATFIKQ